uniref:Protein FAM178B n=1 Tax=Sus scrofa TaxID=9823 RepID=A0A8D1QUK0_PIG
MGPSGMCIRVQVGYASGSWKQRSGPGAWALTPEGAWPLMSDGLPSPPQLSSLIQLLGLMRPSSLGQYLRAEILPPGQDQQPKASAQLDHKVCYLCHSLLTLAGVVVSCQDITPDRWGELQLLCMQLDRHISTHIRESPQAMYWTRLKDLATQTYIRWQELLAHCQPQVVPPAGPQAWEGGGQAADQSPQRVHPHCSC